MKTTRHARKLQRLIFLLLTGIAVSSPAWSASYTYTDLSIRNDGSWGEALGISNNGQVVGRDVLANNTYSLVVWNGATVTPLENLNGNTTRGYYSYGRVINDAGQVAGQVDYDSNHNIHAALWNGATATDLGTLGGARSNAYGINNAGQVVGSASITGSFSTIATLWNGTTATPLYGIWSGIVDTSMGPMRISNGTAHDINDAGQIVGSSEISQNGDRHATLWNGTTVTDLGGLLGRNSSEAVAINNVGQIAGMSYTALTNVGRHAVLWNGTTATDLGTLGGNDSASTDINDAGQVVGWAMAAGSSTHHATLWDGSTAIDLNSFLDASTVSAGWMLLDANGINDNGWIVGTAYNATLNSYHPFLLDTALPQATSPTVPVPTSAWLLGSGLLGLIGVARRKTT